MVADTAIGDGNMGHRELILDYLWSVLPEAATNSQIREATGIGSHQQVFLLTRELMYSRLIRGEQRGRQAGHVLRWLQAVAR